MMGRWMDGWAVHCYGCGCAVEIVCVKIKRRKKTHLLGIIINDAGQLWMRYMATKHGRQELVTAWYGTLLLLCGRHQRCDGGS
jgi:hypothetical protein